MNLRHLRNFSATLLSAVALLPAAQAQLGSIDKDLVFVPINACRIIDTRAAGGQLVAGIARAFDVTAVSDYAFQGGEPTNCSSLGSSAIAGSFAALAVNFTVINPNASGTLKAWAFLAAEPSVADAMSFAAGEVRSNFHIVKIDQGASANEMSVKSSVTAHLTADVVGYFKAAPLPTLQCVETGNTNLPVAAGSVGNSVAPACAAGYVRTSTNCESSTWMMPIVYFQSGTCSAQNNSGSSATLRASSTCCRVGP